MTPILGWDPKERGVIPFLRLVLSYVTVPAFFVFLFLCYQYDTVREAEAAGRLFRLFYYTIALYFGFLAFWLLVDLLLAWAGGKSGAGKWAIRLVITIVIALVATNAWQMDFLAGYPFLMHILFRAGIVGFTATCVVVIIGGVTAGGSGH